MAQDAKGRELAVGDLVMLPCIIRHIQDTGDAPYMDVGVETIATVTTKPIPMTPNKDAFQNEFTTNIGLVGTSQLLRANEGDDLTFEVEATAETKAVKLRQPKG